MQIYLYANALLYGIFAIWCTVAFRSTSSALGYSVLNNSGSSEYLVIYGGLQAGLACAFVLFARDSRLHPVGVQFAVCLYGPIVIYRAATLIRFAPVSGLTLATAALEFALLILGLVLLVVRWP